MLYDNERSESFLPHGKLRKQETLNSIQSRSHDSSVLRLICMIQRHVILCYITLMQYKENIIVISRWKQAKVMWYNLYKLHAHWFSLNKTKNLYWSNKKDKWKCSKEDTTMCGWHKIEVHERTESNRSVIKGMNCNAVERAAFQTHYLTIHAKSQCQR